MNLHRREEIVETLQCDATALTTLLRLEWIVDTIQILDIMRLMMNMAMKAPQSGEGEIVARM